MLDFFKEMGMWGPLLWILALTNIVLVIRGALRLATMKPEDARHVEYGINAILFWGAVAAVVGFLGQHSGLYIALTVISTAPEISPSMVARGFAESLTTTIFGMTILVASAVAWYILLGRYRAVR